MAVLTVPSLEGEDLEGFSIRVAEAWKIGTAENDNGAILLVSRDDREVRIEVGYGLEGKLTDLMSGRIIDQIIVPNFKAGRFDDGFLQATDAIIGAVKGEYKGTGQLPGAQQGKSPLLHPLRSSWPSSPASSAPAAASSAGSPGGCSPLWPACSPSPPAC